MDFDGFGWGIMLEQGDWLLNSDRLTTGGSSRVGTKFGSRDCDSPPGDSELTATMVAGQGKRFSNSGKLTTGSSICVGEILDACGCERLMGDSICIVSTDISSISKPCRLPERGRRLGLRFDKFLFLRNIL